MSDKDGGPAFPQDRSNDPAYTDIGGGMSLRDYFAGQAIAAFGTYSDVYDRGVIGISKICYEIADAMLTERTRENKK